MEAVKRFLLVPFVILAVAALIVLPAFISGCASASNAAFSTEKALGDAGVEAGHSFNVYYLQATNGATASQLEALNAQRARVYTSLTDLGESLAIVEGARLAYATNPAATNSAALVVALTVVTQQETNVVSLVESFMGPLKP